MILFQVTQRISKFHCEMLQRKQRWRALLICSCSPGQGRRTDRRVLHRSDSQQWWHDTEWNTKNLPVELEDFQEGTVKSSHLPSLCLFVKDKPLSLSFPPLLTILFPPFPTLGFLPPDSQEHSPAPDVQDYPRQPQYIPLQICNLQPGPHTCKCTHSPSHRFPGCIHSAHQAVDSVDGQTVHGWIRDTKDMLPQSGAASHITALHRAPPLKPANIGTLQQENMCHC